MIHSLADLESGKLIGIKRLKLACGLNHFPLEILELADSLEILDLSDNNLSELPESIVQLKKMKIIFFANNNFKVFPKNLASCPNLSMIGFKSNQIHTVPEKSFPSTLKWLVLTNNEIKVLPKSIGECTLLQKCALAGNLLEELPLEMANCTNLELLRVSANQLKEIPSWLFRLPKLSWVAFGGNPGAHEIQIKEDLELFDWEDFEIKELLGEGASGFISRANWISKNKEVAIKIFKGDVTSDGLPEDEMAIAIVTGTHENLIPISGKIKNHPDGKSGLIMDLIPKDYTNLGNPPNLTTCTRDTFFENTTFTPVQLLKVAKSIASVCVQMHSKGVSHGDLYAHNIMINQNSNVLLGDFGAASHYDVNSPLAGNIQRVEVRAFACLIEDVLGQIPESELDAKSQEKWLQLISDCKNIKVNSRPDFSQLRIRLNDF